MIGVAERKKALDVKRLTDIRGGTYYKPGGGADTGAPTRAPAGIDPDPGTS
jgi:hypothetical protein